MRKHILAGLTLVLGVGAAYANLPSQHGGKGPPGGASFALPGTPVAAYSTRKVIAAYAGNDVQLTRTSDSTTQNIGFVGSDFDVATANTFCALTLCQITIWYDQMGSHNITLGSTSGSAPPVLSIINGKAYVSFNNYNTGANSGNPAILVAAASLGVTGDISIGMNAAIISDTGGFAVADYDGTNGYLATLNGFPSGGSQTVGANPATIGYWASGDGTFNPDSSTIFSKSPNQIAWLRGSGTVNYYRNNTTPTLTLTSQASSSDSSVFALGSEVTSATATPVWPVSEMISEAYVYASNIGTTNLGLIQAAEQAYFPDLGFEAPSSGQAWIQGGSNDTVSCTCSTITAWTLTHPWTVWADIQPDHLPSHASSILNTFQAYATAFPNYPGFSFRIEGSDSSHMGTLSVLIDHVIGTTYIEVRTNTSIVDGFKHRVAATYSGSGTAAGVAIYVDGVAQSTTTVSDTLGGNTINASGQTVFIASQNGEPNYMRGQIGHVQVDSVAASSGTVSANASYTVAPPITANTVASWAFTEGQGTTANDASGNANTATLSTNSMWVPNNQFTSSTWPAGVTTSAIDGESETGSVEPKVMTHTFYSAFANAAAATYSVYPQGWNSLNFIPIGPWESPIQGSSDVTTWKYALWNTQMTDNTTSDMTLFAPNNWYSLQNAGTGGLTTGAGVETVGLLTADDGAGTYADAVTTPIGTSTTAQLTGRFLWWNTAWQNMTGAPINGSPGAGTIYSQFYTPVSHAGCQSGGCIINVQSNDQYAFAGCNDTAGLASGINGQAAQEYQYISQFPPSTTTLTSAQCTVGASYGDMITIERANLYQGITAQTATATWSGGIATITLGSSIPSAQIPVGSRVLLTGFLPIGYNGAVKVVSITGSPVTSFTVAIATNPGTSSTQDGFVGYNYVVNPPVSQAPHFGLVEDGGPYLQNTDAASYIRPPQMNVAVWSSMIHGARGITWFDYSFAGPGGSDKNLQAAYYQAIQTGNTTSVFEQARDTDYAVEFFADELNSQNAVGYTSITSTGAAGQCYTADNDFVMPPTKAGIEIRTTAYQPTAGTYDFTIFADSCNPLATASGTVTFKLLDTAVTGITATDGFSTVGTTTSSGTSIPMGQSPAATFNPGWVVAGQTVTDETTNQVIGTVSSWSSSSASLVLAAGVAHTVTAGDVLGFTRALSVTGVTGGVTFTDAFATGTTVHVYQVSR